VENDIGSRSHLVVWSEMRGSFACASVTVGDGDGDGDGDDGDLNRGNGIDCEVLQVCVSRCQLVLGLF
jgi:hypothetical protein